MISTLPKWVSSLFGNALRPNMKIVEIIYLSTAIKQIRFKGDISKWNFQAGYANVIRINDTDFRNYSVATYNIEESTFDMIFTLHGNGVGSDLIASLQVGDELFISLPRGKRLYESFVEQQLFFGDETSLGLACFLLPLFKENKQRFHFYFELNASNEEVPQRLGLENFTIVPKNNACKEPTWMESLSLFEDPSWVNANFILTGNVNSVQQIRKTLKAKKGGKICFQGYWLEGKKGL
ncbi:siderophore-interacting protein [Myroides sp. DF42-4-2]|uniref:siderophore-interacting protein n=1 Tax=Myroides sp. DF42-4-2 TaxID=2746726 RepID=UPI0025789B57|nr:siderophore-interacting protein [Myroides sp. DF42-4-2]MDM1407430.1 siderophore-interacting protein [Myroides sp. DF42-4-2]